MRLIPDEPSQALCFAAYTTICTTVSHYCTFALLKAAPSILAPLVSSGRALNLPTLTSTPSHVPAAVYICIHRR